ncbi:MAG: polyprenyl synthetase family protein [Beijerinckiaceae bacterium]|nr:polyprenyl synthetase family protein [Beijerinckiaceae bacterium]
MIRFEQKLEAVLREAQGAGCPPRLGEAMHYSVFPGGARIRPRLVLAVAKACGARDPGLALSAAAAIELLHCASLVHDDLPCFDDADLRRGKPSVHCAFGEPLAVLAGDALIVLAFEVLTRSASVAPARLGNLVRIIAGAVGSRGGITAGQAWEAEPEIDLDRYHQAKTGALFAGATMAGAAAAGMPHAEWRALGEQIGAAFQVADDIRDVAGRPEEIGKPNGQDAMLHRPNVVHQLGLSGAVRHLDSMIVGAIEQVPACPGRAELQAQIRIQANSFLPEELARRAA